MAGLTANGPDKGGNQSGIFCSGIAFTFQLLHLPGGGWSVLDVEVERHFPHLSSLSEIDQGSLSILGRSQSAWNPEDVRASPVVPVTLQLLSDKHSFITHA